VLTGPNVILALKVAVAAVTVLLAASLVALARGRYRLHGRINLVFFTLTLAALLLFELVLRVLKPGIFEDIRADEGLSQALNVHLCFAVPAAVLLPGMLYTGLSGRGKVHVVLAMLFSVLWAGTFVTGIFFLPYTG
jgi:uncharacterized membrane protein YozB (DUF420 family)